jgi:KaiC/GvpD/RAD55 family RecA-like ATPase
MNRVPSGIKGFDELVGGGIPERDIILLSGECGAGKSVFGLQFLVSSKSNGIYVSFEDDAAKISETAAVFGWDIKKLQKEDRIRVLRYDPFKLEDIIEIVESNIKEIDAKRVVIDSVSALGIYMKEISEIRRMVLQIESALRKNGCTALLISEIIPGRHGISRFGVEEFVTDGVVSMKRYTSKGEIVRGLEVIKMRGTKHSLNVHSYEITKDGIIVGDRLKQPQP